MNVAENQRNAGRDYFEINQVINIRYFLITRPEDELNNLATANEKMFKRRFGIVLNRCVRSKIIKLKNEHGMTDDQIITLIQSGQIRHVGGEIMIVPSIFNIS